jgi:DNA-binding MarR family transcriptional regulator
MINNAETVRLPAIWEQVLRAVAEQHSTTIQALSERLLLRPAAARNIVLALERRGLIGRAEGLYDPNGHHERLVIFTTRLGRRWLRRHPGPRPLSLAA